MGLYCCGEIDKGSNLPPFTQICLPFSYIHIHVCIFLLLFHDTIFPYLLYIYNFAQGVNKWTRGLISQLKLNQLNYKG